MAGTLVLKWQEDQREKEQLEAREKSSKAMF